MNKKRDLLIILIIYIVSYAAGFIAASYVDGLIFKWFIFDTAATIVSFIFSTILRNSSVYDAYWSLTPMVMIICLFADGRAQSMFQLLFFVAFNIWSIRLTINWITVFTDFSYEDWRYSKLRNASPKLLWPLVNYFGIHYMPTLIVFAGMLPIFKIITNPLGIKSLPGIIIILVGVTLEYMADRDMHEFLASNNRSTVCQTGLWNYSRHPNYLGEITVWLGVYLTMLPYEPSFYYLGIGFISVAVMFNIISIPLMENRQKAKREAYKDYCKSTSRLLILPKR